MNKLKKIFHTLNKESSIFHKTLAGLLILAIAMILFFGILLNSIVLRSHRRQVAESILSRLIQVDESINLAVDVLSQGMDQILWSNDFITYLVTPESADQEQDYRIIRQISSSVGSSDLVCSAFLYSPYAEEIHDNSAIYTPEEYEDWFVIEEHLAEISDDSGQTEGLSEARTLTSVVLYEERLFVIVDLDIASYIGSLVYEINLSALSEELGLMDAEGELSILVYNEQKTRVFDSVLNYGVTGIVWMEEDQFVTAENYLQKVNQTSGYYRYDSDTLGWTYLMALDTGSLSLTFRDVLAVYLPAAAVFLVISALFALYISNSIYRPINRLLTLVTASDGKEKEPGDGEIDYLEGAYTYAIEQKEQLQGILSGIAPEVMDSMLYNLLVGKHLTEQRVKEILEGIGNPIHVQGRFLIMVCRMFPPEDRVVTDAELNLYMLSIHKLLDSLNSDDYQAYDIHSERWEVTILLAFPAECAAVTVKKEYVKLSGQVEKLSDQIPCRIKIERGSIYQNLLDIRYAYQEAADKLQYQIYLEDAPSAAEEPSEQILNSRYFKERTKTMAEQAAHGDRTGAEALLQRILEDLEKAARDLEEFRSLAGSFLDEIAEQVIALPLSEEDQQRIEKLLSVSRLTALSSREEMETGILEAARSSLHLIHTYSGKNRYKYVEQAKDYIARNYADSNLSLNDVGEHVGISGSYLSELFNEIGGEKFSAYLATFRVEKAKQLLQTTNVTIKEIGFLCGFNSIQNFIRVFKKYVGMTPGQYREKNS